MPLPFTHLYTYDLDLWPRTLKHFRQLPLAWWIFVASFHWNPSTKYRDITLREIGGNRRTKDSRTTQRRNASPPAVGGVIIKTVKYTNRRTAIRKMCFLANISQRFWYFDRMLSLTWKPLATRVQVTLFCCRTHASVFPIDQTVHCRSWASLRIQCWLWIRMTSFVKFVLNLCN